MSSLKIIHDLALEAPVITSSPPLEDPKFMLAEILRWKEWVGLIPAPGRWGNVNPGQIGLALAMSTFLRNSVARAEVELFDALTLRIRDKYIALETLPKPGIKLRNTIVKIIKDTKEREGAL